MEGGQSVLPMVFKAASRHGIPCWNERGRSGRAEDEVGKHDAPDGVTRSVWGDHMAGDDEEEGWVRVGLKVTHRSVSPTIGWR